MRDSHQGWGGVTGLKLSMVGHACSQISNNIINTRGGGIQVGGEYILTSEYLMNNITISGNTIYNTQANTISVFTASKASSPVGLSPAERHLCQGVWSPVPGSRCAGRLQVMPCSRNLGWVNMLQGPHDHGSPAPGSAQHQHPQRMPAVALWALSSVRPRRSP